MARHDYAHLAAAAVVLATTVVFSCGDRDESKPVVPDPPSGDGWRVLGGEEGAVRAIAWGSGGLLVGGVFDEIGGVSGNGLLRWSDGWEAVDGWHAERLNGVEAIGVNSRGDVLVGGWFQLAGENGVALLRDGQWLDVGGGVSGEGDAGCVAVAANDARWLVMGNFDAAGGRVARNVAEMTDSWTALGRGVATGVFESGPSAYDACAWGATWALARTVPDASAPRLLIFVQGDWSAVQNPTSVSDVIFAVQEFQGVLMVGGDFASSANGAEGCVAAYDGLGWSPLDEHLQGVVRDMQRVQNRLYLCGEMRAADNGVTHHVAIWDGKELKWVGPALDPSSRVDGIAVGEKWIAVRGYVRTTDGQRGAVAVLRHVLGS